MTVVTGLVFPAVLFIVKRHYESNPNAWEEIVVTGLLGAAAVGVAIWLLTLEPFEAGSWGAILVGIPLGWVIIFGLGAMYIAGDRALEVTRETRGK